MRKAMLVIACVGLLGSVRLDVAAVEIEETIVGPAYDQSTKYILSPRGLHLATVHAKGSRFVVTVDGVEGPPYEEILQVAVMDPVAFNESNAAGFTHVAFSRDGTRFAYAARSGKDIVVVVDGKEIHRAPRTTDATGYPSAKDPVFGLAFTPDGKHAMWLAAAADAPKELLSSGWEKVSMGGDVRIVELHVCRLMFDGKPVSPPFVQVFMRFPVFSTDGSRWVLLAGRPGTEATGRMLIVDGKDEGDPGDVVVASKLATIEGRAREVHYEHPRFAPGDNRLVSLRRDPKSRGEQLLVDGKPILSSAEPINGFYLSAKGDIAAVATDRDGKRRLFVNGKSQTGTEHALHINMVVGVTDDYRPVVFSPDGNRWAVVCGDGTEQWVVVDGNKQIAYTSISGLRFTPDGSRCIYGAEVAGASGMGRFLVVEGEEFRVTDFSSETYKPVFSQGGGRVAFQTSMPGTVMKRQLYLDGKPLPEVNNVRSFTFSPDGSRYAYFNVSDPMGSASLMIDDEVVAKAVGGGAIVFSGDSRHLATIASPPKGGGGTTICVDGEFLPSPKGMQYPQMLAFTADHRNLLFVGAESGPQIGNTRSYYLNGERVAQFSHMAVSSFGSHAGNSGQPLPWELQPDGSVLLIGAEPNTSTGGVMKRIKVTAAADTSTATWIADVKAEKDRELAEAQARKEKAEADRIAAQQKAEADRLARKMAAEEAAAQRKAEAEAKRAELDAKRKADAEARRAAQEAARKAKSSP